MKVGLIARTENRGLGNLTWEWAEHMRPDRVLVVVPNHRVPQRTDRYGQFERTTVSWEPGGDLDERTVRAWLDGLDVVYSAETFYDWRICNWARDAGVRSICHVMPEFYRHGQADPPPGPDVWWTPTGWLLERLDPATRVVPVPIALERFRRARRAPDGPPRWLHVAGTRAAADRNGTRLFTAALRLLNEEHDVTIRAQNATLPVPAAGRATRVRIAREATAEYWELYTDAEALVLPRRYAGLSLPALEAMGAGLALMMTDVEPQRSEWPILRLRPSTRTRTSLRTAVGDIPLAGVDPATIATAMDAAAREPAILEYARAEAARFATANSWAELKPRITGELERAAG